MKEDRVDGKVAVTGLVRFSLDHSSLMYLYCIPLHQRILIFKNEFS